MSERPAIVWYRDDLRIHDHRPLLAAAARGSAVIPVYVLDDASSNSWCLGGASRWWLHQSLSSLESDLRALGSRLVILRGDTVRELARLVDDQDADALYFHRRFELFEHNIETALGNALGDRIEVRRFRGRLLNEPEQIKNQSGDPFRVFTPFYKACLRLPEVDAPQAAPARLPPVANRVKGLTLESLSLSPTRPDWAGGLRERWVPGEGGAWSRLNAFLDGAAQNYGEGRDIPGIEGTSSLSPHLHFGELSPRQIWHAVREAQMSQSVLTRGGDAFLRELIWREFCHHLLFHWPTIPEQPFNENYTHFPWSDDAASFTVWTRGETGYPLVDAGMRELWTTGWMHNRVRMVTASFLVKHLLISWKLGQSWFWDTLVDADLANNSCGWQWVAGCGADAAPYFRIFNPVLQGRKFDPAGAYIRHWIPELRDLPDKYIHAPFEASPAVCTAAGVKLGENYPSPMVEHTFARNRALDALKAMRR
jgi:deoxyribodipyrimidine photo-lyase